jgi:hypothetical protein
MMNESVLCRAIGAPFVGHLSDETVHPLEREENMSKAEVAPVVELTHEVIVKLVSELENGINYDKQVEGKTKDDIKKLKDARRQVSKSVYGRVHEVSYMVNMAIQKGTTSVKKVSEDSGVSMSTISRYDWIGATLSNVGLTKTSEKLAQKSLNLLIQGVFNKSDMLNIKDVEHWKQLIQDKTFKLPNAPKLESVTEAIGNGSYDEALDKLESAINTRRKMMIKA